MSGADNGGPAFPASVALTQGNKLVVTPESFRGMTLRDYFAAQADIGDVDQLTAPTGVRLLGRECPSLQQDARACLAWWAEYRACLRYIEADAMLAERTKTGAAS